MLIIFIATNKRQYTEKESTTINERNNIIQRKFKKKEVRIKIKKKRFVYI